MREQFLRLHQSNRPLVIPNPWDVGSARILEGEGFEALATTSSGLALTLGRRDYSVNRDAAMRHAESIAAAVSVPVSADLENGFGRSTADVEMTVRQAVEAGLAGCSIEDTSGDAGAPILGHSEATERVQAAAEIASKHGLVLTARADGLLHGSTDLGGVLARLLAYERLGADVLYAPGLPHLEAVREVCAAVEAPVNVLPIFGLGSCSTQELAACGVARISLGGRLAFDADGRLASIAAAVRRGDLAGLGAHSEEAKRVATVLGPAA